LNFRRLAFLAKDVVDVFIGEREDYRLIGIDSNESLQHRRNISERNRKQDHLIE
jgi:hypothetical protein